MPTVLLSLSGGADSATLLARYLSSGYEAQGVFMDYGSKQNPLELRAAKALAAHYGIPLHVHDLRGVFAGMPCAMMQGDARSIPQGAYDAASMSQTVVPGRNTIFAAILAGMAEAMRVEALALAMHGGDHALYPDCRPEYAAALARTIALSTEGGVRLETPFIAMSKTDIIALGLQLGVPYELTRSCYTAETPACGQCGTCVERRRAFCANNAQDPLPYAPQPAYST